MKANTKATAAVIPDILFFMANFLFLVSVASTETTEIAISQPGSFDTTNNVSQIMCRKCVWQFATFKDDKITRDVERLTTNLAV